MQSSLLVHEHRITTAICSTEGQALKAETTHGETCTRKGSSRGRGRDRGRDRGGKGYYMPNSWDRGRGNDHHTPSLINPTLSATTAISLVITSLNALQTFTMTKESIPTL